MQTRTRIQAHEDLLGCCCSPLISLTLLGTGHMLYVARGRGCALPLSWYLGNVQPCPRAGRRAREPGIFRKCFTKVVGSI